MRHLPDREPSSRLRGLLFALAAGGLALTFIALVDPALGTLPAGRASGGVPPAGDTVTFTRDVAPILFENCSSCHRPGGPGPFSVLSYEEVRSRADLIADYTARRYMPPWLPEAGYREFAGTRRLADGEIATIRAWAAAGAPEGDPADLPPAPTFTSVWPLGEPDLVVEMPDYEVPGNGRDLYRNLVAAVPGDARRYVRAVDLRPGNPTVVHHARLMVDATTSSREQAATDSEPGFDGMEVRSNARNPSGHFVGWTPGRVPHGGYEELAWALEPGSDLVLQLHLRPSGRAETVRPRVGFYLADEPPSRTAALVSLGTEVIDIPAGEPNYVVTDSFTLPVPVEVLSVYPHAHYLGKTMEGLAHLPDGRTEHLIRIDDWDFNWQDEYRLAEPLSLPAGTVLAMRFTYDNSADNPQNPSEPPVRVTYGSASTDEMADLLVQVVPRSAAAAETLNRELARKYERGFTEYFAWREYTLGLEAAEAGDLEGALRHYRASLRNREDPEVMVAMVDVATRMDDPETAVLLAERAAQVTQFRDLVVLDRLVSAYAAAGRVDRAVDVLERAVDLAPESAEEEELMAALRERLERLRDGGGG